ncbi:hypothetical protein EGT07_16635 [Herbaspirillum sp. HC18]|nr:hypothetical protein EGT07_16635 [Herbaspirillum sp. HC18]
MPFEFSLICAEFNQQIDGEPPGASRDPYVADKGNGTVSVPRLYQLVRQLLPVIDRSSRSSFPAPIMEAFAFTFG